MLLAAKISMGALFLARCATAEESHVPSWAAQLEAQGFLVQEGEMGIFDVDTCSKSDTCYALNPLTPYGLFYLPPNKNSKATTVKSYKNSCYGHNLCKTKKDGSVLYPDWRLDLGETIVVVGKTPPKSTYWSFTNYLYTRYNPAGWKSNATDMSKKIVACPPGPSRCEIFAGINDPLNHLTVETASGDAFNASFSMILSSDSKSEAVVSRALAKDASAGPPNALRFPGEILNLGISRGDEDEFLNVMRVEGIESEADRKAFYENMPMRVFRVTPPASFQNNVTKSDMFPSFDGRMRNRYTGVAERAPDCNNQALKSGLAALVDAVEKTYSKGIIRTNHAKAQFSSFVQDSGYECVYSGLKCQGDCRDTIYAKATFLVQELLCNKTHVPCKPSRKSELTDQVDDFYIVVGVNHQRTSQSSYSSQTLYNFPKLASGQIASGKTKELKYTEMESASDLAGSADMYFKDDEKTCATPNLYSIMFARNCSASATRGELCYNVLSKPSSAHDLAIGYSQPIVFIERMYIHGGSANTKSGPAVNETILPVAIHFRNK